MQKIIERFFTISHDASASLIITLSTFILGYLITGLVFIINRYFERKSNRKIFIQNLESLDKSLKRQQRAFIDTIKSFDIVKNSPWEYSKVHFFQVTVFKEMSYKESFKSFFLGFENQLSVCTNKTIKRKAYNKTWENLNNIQFWSEKAFNDFNPLLDKYNQHGDRRNVAINQLRQMWEHLFQDCKVEREKFTDEEYEYLRKLDKIIGVFQNIPTDQRIKPYTTHRYLVLPIRILNKKYQLTPFIRKLNDITLEASKHYREMELLLRQTRIQYQEYFHLFRAIQKINEMTIKILSLKFYTKISYSLKKLYFKTATPFR